MTINLLDAARNLTPYIPQIVAAGVQGVGRYYSSSDPEWPRAKDLTREEAAALTAAGLDIYVFWETTAGRALQGLAAGLADGLKSVVQAAWVGQPRGTPIIFAVDQDVGDEDMAAVRAYFTGVNTSLNDDYSAWNYGSGLVCKRLSESGLAHGSCKAGARGWRGYADWPDPNILQGAEYARGGPYSLPFGHDVATARLPRYGGWRVGGPAEARPVVPPESGMSTVPIPSAVDMQLALKAEKLYFGAIDGDKPGGWGPLSQAALAEHYARKH